MSAPTKKKQPPTFDVDALIAETTVEAQPVMLKFRGQEWEFKGITEAPINLFDDELETAQSSLFFLRTMLCDGQEFPADVTLREASALVNAYSQEAARITAGE